MRNRIIRTLLFLITISVASSCTFTTINNDLEKDVNAGKQFMGTFYNSVKEKNYATIEKLESDSLAKIAKNGALIKVFKLVNRKAGDFQSFIVTKAESRRITKNGSAVVFWRLNNKVTYSKAVVDEVVGLIQEGDGAIKLISYNAFSDVLMEP